MALEKAGNISPVLGEGGAFQKGLSFLLNLAWEACFRLPALITVGFMLFDIRMQLDMNMDIEVRRVVIQTDDENNGDRDRENDDDDSSDTIEYVDADSLEDEERE
ncbi:hypothetical protein C0J52_12673 [Blattella germanica]|nr:hypothetical protein C0J52_12673 [Blattella germanica]